MTRILFEGVRCFHDQYTHPVKPITILVGENSSGKSTFMAINRIAWDAALGGLGADIFNEEPFLLGSYEQIASFRGGKAGRVKSFCVGIETSTQRVGKKRPLSRLFGETARVTARFVSQEAQSTLSEWTFECGRLRVVVKPSTNKPRLDMTIKTSEGTRELNGQIPFLGWIGVDRILMDLTYFASSRYRDPSEKREKGEELPSIMSESELSELREIAFQMRESLGARPFAFAPIRTRPKRTYDPLQDIPEPEGSHVPMILAKTLRGGSDEAGTLRKTLSDFGATSGLFKAVEIRRKGSKESDPFQIGIKTSAQVFNLVDVGYGVSQVLPILVDATLNRQGSSFLLQQPEVHLHPKAQAALGTFLASLAKTQDKRFVIETHSDHLIDRIRMDVKDKKYGLSPGDVALLYFERSRGDVKIHNLELDSQGNITNSPPTYRQFFLDEERRMMGF